MNQIAAEADEMMKRSSQSLYKSERIPLSEEIKEKAVKKATSPTVKSGRIPWQTDASDASGGKSQIVNVMINQNVSSAENAQESIRRTITNASKYLR